MTANPYRLARAVLPTHYDLELAPDLAAASFDGRVGIDLDVVEPVASFAINIRDLAIASVAVTSGGRTVDTSFSIDEATERLTIEGDVPAGPARLDIVFTGVLNDKLRGFYRSTYTDAAGDTKVIATSQMQPTDCRAAFPCFDEPDFKATFATTLIVDEGLVAISNGAETARRPMPGGKVAVEFATTMKMSTYLVAFVVGELDTSEVRSVNGTPVRIVHVPGKGHLADFGLDCSLFFVEWFENYYGIPYPSSKIDLVALPDFAAGAMENLGCITFRESLLLVDPATATQAEKEVVADVVAHELAHMWFGDLVTMRWWNGIWLNEAFATFMEVAACEAWRPEWRRWTTFSLERSAAYEVDALSSTRSVEFEVNSPDDSEGMFDVLTYQKGGALLRMLEQYLGPEVFRDGVRHYLTTHAYGNTETGDLWDAIEHVSGQPVRSVMDSWIWQPGFPLITASVEAGQVVLRQERFSFDPASLTDPQVWRVPLHVRQVAGGRGSLSDATGMVAAFKETTVLLDGDEARLALISPDATVVVNAGAHAFVRVEYDDELRYRHDDAALAGMSTVERYALVDDAWAAVVAGRLSAEGFLDLATAFADERELQVWQILSAALKACGRLVDGAAYLAFQARVRALAGPALTRLGWTPSADEGDLVSKLRGVLVTLLATTGADQAVQAKARALYQLHLDGIEIDPELLAATTTVVAATGDADDYDRFLEGFRTGSTPQDQLRNLYALTEFDDAALITRTCELAMSSEVKTQNAPLLLNRCIANRHHGQTAWRFVRQHWADANDRFPISLIARMIDPVKLLNQPSDTTDLQAFFAEHPIPQAAKTLEQILERQQVNASLRAREGDRFGNALTGR